MTSVTSVAVPPVDRLAVDRRYTTWPAAGTDCAVSPTFVQHLLGLGIELEPREHFLVADAAARILIHDFDELRDRVFAIARHVPGRATRGGNQLAVDDEQPMIVALEKGLHDHRP